MMRPYATPTLALLAALILACGDGTSTTSTPSPAATLPIVTVIFTNGPDDQVELVVEVANDAEERARGLQFRDSLPKNRGMLFEFEKETEAGFWMKDTTIPLSIAFIEGEGDVLDIQDMEPLSEGFHYSPEPYLYAVEVNRGWFERNGVRPGSGIRLAPGQTP